MLLLDEPTNHLDLDAVEALIHALLEFEGGLLIISHDEHLVNSVAETLWVAQARDAMPQDAARARAAEARPISAACCVLARRTGPGTSRLGRLQGNRDG